MSPVYAGGMMVGVLRFKRPLQRLAALALLCAPAPAEALTLLQDPFDTESELTVSPRYRSPDHPCRGKPPERPLDLFDVVSFALCNNPQTRTSWATALGQAASLGRSKSAYLPSISGSASGSRSASFSESSKTSSKGTSAGFSMGMLLYDFGRRELSLELAENALKSANYSHDSTLQTVISTTLRAYYQYLSSRKAVGAAMQSETFAGESLEAASLRHEIGQVPLADKLQAEAAYEQSVLTRQQAENTYTINQATLATLMGLAPTYPLAVAETEAEGETDPLALDVEQMIAYAKQRRPDFASSLIQVQSAEKSLDLAERADLPSISVSAGESFSDIDIFNNSTTRSQSIGVSLSIPIFSGFSHTYSVRSAQLQLEAQRATLERTELELALDVWRSYQNFATAKQSLQTSRKFLKSATQLSDVALGRYKAGVGSILDVLNAQTQFSSASQRKIEAEYNLFTTRADLVRSIGALDLDTMEPGTEVPAGEMANDG